MHPVSRSEAHLVNRVDIHASEHRYRPSNSLTGGLNASKVPNIDAEGHQDQYADSCSETCVERHASLDYNLHNAATKDPDAPILGDIYHDLLHVGVWSEQEIAAHAADCAKHSDVDTLDEP